MKQSKICVIGAGNWGKNHIKILHEMDALGAIAEIDINLLQSFKNNYPKIELFTDYKESIKNSYDGYIITTNAETHFDIAEFLIKNKKHVFIEKPITLNSKTAIELHDLSEKFNVNLMVGHILLFHPAFQKIKAMIENGTLGTLQYMYSNRVNHGRIRSEENVFWSFAPHDISIFQYFTNSFPSKITSRGSDILQDGVHDTTITTIEYPNNVMGHIFVSWLHPFKEHRFVVVGGKGMIRFEDSAEGKPLVLYDKGVEWVNGTPISRSGDTQLIDYEKTMPLTAELQYFVDHLDGTKLAKNTSKDAIDVIKILEIATKSLVENN